MARARATRSRPVHKVGVAKHRHRMNDSIWFYDHNYVNYLVNFTPIFTTQITPPNPNKPSHLPVQATITPLSVHRRAGGTTAVYWRKLRRSTRLKLESAVSPFSNQTLKPGVLSKQLRSTRFKFESTVSPFSNQTLKPGVLSKPVSSRGQAGVKPGSSRGQACTSTPTMGSPASAHTAASRAVGGAG